MKLLFRNRIATWLTASLAVLVLAACGQTTTVSTHGITVTVTGAGTVSALDGDIECTSADEDTCSATIDDGTEVTFTATPDNVGDTVTWGGACAGATGDTCTVTVNEDTNVSATFEAAAPAEPELNVNVTGDGTVSGAGGAIDCTTAGGATCVATLASGDEVTLTATAAEGGDPFIMWSGDACDGVTDTTCTFTSTGDTTVSAIFGTFSTEYRRAYAHDTSVPNAPVLSVTYEPAGGGTAVPVTSSITADNHDAEEFISASLDSPTTYPAGFTYTDSSDLELGYDPTHGPQLVGLLFQDLDIPADATVTAASITFTAFAQPDVGSGNDVALTVEAQDSVNPSAFANDADTESSEDLSGRTRLTPSVDLTISGAWTADTAVEIDGLETLVQAAIEQADWGATADNDNIAFIISPTAP